MRQENTGSNLKVNIEPLACLRTAAVLRGGAGTGADLPG